jgi:hypothetical protein
VPNWQSYKYGLSNPVQPFPGTYDLKGDAAWRDQERDADGDGLNNRMESAKGPSTNAWWNSFWANDKRFSPAIEPWGKKFYCGTQSPGYFAERPFAELDLADSDVDGDGLLDGEDDQDNDDVNNITEVYEEEKDLDGNGGAPGSPNPAWCGYGVGVVPSINFGGVDSAVNPFNPCAPDPNSRTCQDYVPF